MSQAELPESKPTFHGGYEKVEWVTQDRGFSLCLPTTQFSFGVWILKRDGLTKVEPPMHNLILGEVGFSLGKGSFRVPGTHGALFCWELLKDTASWLMKPLGTKELNVYWFSTGHRLAGWGEEIFTLRTHFMIWGGISENSIRKMARNIQNPYLRDLSKWESYQIKKHYKWKRAAELPHESQWGLRRGLAVKSQGSNTSCKHQIMSRM